VCGAQVRSVCSGVVGSGINGGEPPTVAFPGNVSFNGEAFMFTARWLPVAYTVPLFPPDVKAAAVLRYARDIAAQPRSSASFRLPNDSSHAVATMKIRQGRAAIDA